MDPTYDFTGQVAFVTGASSGMGLATTRAFAEAGAAVVMAADHFSGEYGRIRDVTVAPDGDLWFVTNNTDGRGDPGLDEDRILSVDVEGRHRTD